MAIALEGKTALVTGGGRGIGKAIARRLAEAGANVAIASRKIENLEATAREFSPLPGKIAAVACNVGRAAEIQTLVAEVERRLGPVDILVNNSATNIGQGPALDVTDEAHDENHRGECALGGAADPADGAGHDRARERSDHEYRIDLGDTDAAGQTYVVHGRHA